MPGSIVSVSPPLFASAPSSGLATVPGQVLSPKVTSWPPSSTPSGANWLQLAPPLPATIELDSVTPPPGP